MTHADWFVINETDRIDSPALCFYEERIRQNIRRLLETVKPERVRPHVKTNKTAEVCRMMMDAGISKFKCATIAEAEMLGMIGAKDVLLAYPLTGPKTGRFLRLTKKYPATRFSCLVDDPAAAAAISGYFTSEQSTADIYIDLNVGMNRTGILPKQALALYEKIRTLKGIRMIGLHAYDGHIHDADPEIREARCLEAFKAVSELKKTLESFTGYSIGLVAGGSPTFPIHAHQEDRECSPGTFVFWDEGYRIGLPDQPFEYAALLLCRVISIPGPHIVCVDLGHKSVASENPQPRAFFLNAPDAIPTAHNEEHLTLTVPDSSQYKTGQVLYAAPWHICPTVALYDKASVIQNNRLAGEWEIIARRREISI